MTNRNGASHTASDVGGKIDERIDSIKDSVRGLVDNTQQRAADIKKRALGVKNDAMSRGHAVLDRTSDLIKENPLKAVAIAFGVGYIGMRIFR